MYTEDELHAVLTLIYLAIYLDVDPVKSFPLKQATKTVAEQLGKLIETAVGGSSSFSGGGKQNDSVTTHGSTLLKSLLQSGLSASEIAWNKILPTAVATVPAQGAAVRILINTHLSLLLRLSPRAKETAHILIAAPFAARPSRRFLPLTSRQSPPPTNPKSRTEALIQRN